jgi:hypothetical protein
VKSGVYSTIIASNRYLIVRGAILAGLGRVMPEATVTVGTNSGARHGHVTNAIV